MADLYWLQMTFLLFVEWLALGVSVAMLFVVLVAVMARSNNDDR
jgi:hypothetical protein